MFTGIVETTGKVIGINREGSNLIFDISCPFVHELMPGQSVLHDGVCLTVTDVYSHHYRVVAIEETLHRTNLKYWCIEYSVNLERSMPVNGRFEGHIVQGHVDTVAVCHSITDKNGSREYHFIFDEAYSDWIVEKGSICVNGVSLTVTYAGMSEFSVAIIPYTFSHTNFNQCKVKDFVNIEFDILGKYVKRMFSMRKN
ncbi:MAG: riboflavin synthase [Cytophagaceae bacterium]|nr:riboflavin synthase [Cytophagaceae bacterium]MDW8455641.1 riboflavin synthase [Cytophagaceae bacterium]